MTIARFFNANAARDRGRPDRLSAMTKNDAPKWEFKARFRRGAFGWKSQPAVQRVKEAVAEIKRAARKDPALAAEGAVTFLERVSPALEHVDSSSGSIGNAVNNAVAELVPVIARAPADGETRAKWLERLFAAHAADQIPYIERLADHWGELCASKEVASDWADRLLDPTRSALRRDRTRVPLLPWDDGVPERAPCRGQVRRASRARAG